MPTILSHAVVPLALALGLGKVTVSRRLLAAGVMASILPDADGIAFKLGIAYHTSFGHRGASHSLLFVLLVACIACVCARQLRCTSWKAFAFVGVSALSHPLLDMLTNGGLGVALFWPWSDVRYFAPWQVVEVSPIALRRVFSARGAVVLGSEMAWIWLPALMMALGLTLVRLARQRALT